MIIHQIRRFGSIFKAADLNWAYLANNIISLLGSIYKNKVHNISCMYKINCNYCDDVYMLDKLDVRTHNTL